MMNSSVGNQFMIQPHFPSVEEPRMESSGSRKSQAKNVMPVSIRHCLQHSDSNGPLEVEGLEVGLLQLVGQVRMVEESETNTTYQVEDDTGRIEVIFWHQEEDNRQHIVANTFVKIVGTLRSGRDHNLVTAYRMLPISDMAEVTSHMLEVVVTPLRIKRLQMIATCAAQASLSGMSMFGQSGRLSSGIQMQPQMSSGDGRQRLTQYTQTQLNKPGAAAILKVIKSTPTHMGISRMELYNVCGVTQSEVDSLLEYLAQEGHVYTTLDQDHFKSTDA